jgi:hypothetical protein
MRITVTAKGDLEEYIKQEMERNGLSAGLVCLNLALAGKEYKESLKSFSVLATALQNQSMSKGENTIDK